MEPQFRASPAPPPAPTPPFSHAIKLQLRLERKQVGPQRAGPVLRPSEGLGLFSFVAESTLYTFWETIIPVELKVCTVGGAYELSN